MVITRSILIMFCITYCLLLNKKDLSNRVDVFIEQSAFNTSDALNYLAKAKQLGFEVTVHADQFTTGGSEVAIKARAASADHLEASGDYEIKLLANSDTVAVTLPGASLGLGMAYAPARKLLGCRRLPGHSQRLEPRIGANGRPVDASRRNGRRRKAKRSRSICRSDSPRGPGPETKRPRCFSQGKLADMQAYPCDDYREILYQQGKLKPEMVWTEGLKN
jgi:imidazolonepropionase